MVDIFGQMKKAIEDRKIHIISCNGGRGYFNQESSNNLFFTRQQDANQGKRATLWS